jgi:hypothetical protein
VCAAVAEAHSELQRVAGIMQEASIRQHTSAYVVHRIRQHT